MHEKPKAPQPKRYADMEYNELTSLYNAHSQEGGDQKIKREIMKYMRTWLRNQEEVMREEERAEKAESEKQKNLLKETRDTLRSTRKIYLDMYRDMNSFITTRSLVTNLDNFEESVREYKKADYMFMVAVDAHIEKMREAKTDSSPLVVTQEENFGT